MNCTNCGAPIPNGAQFCTGCGAPAQQPGYQVNTDNLPVRAIGFGEAISNYFKQYAKFSGRATRREYWFIVLFNMIVSLVISIIGGLISEQVVSVLSTLWSLATLVPGLALVWRRLHDIGKRGTWILLNLIPLVGSIILLVFFCRKSDRDNQFGPRKVEGVL